MLSKIAGLLALALAIAAPVLAAEPYMFRDVRPVACSKRPKDCPCADGDTCRFNLRESHPILGKVTFEDWHVRLLGIDAPELHPARCDAEREAGEKAKARLVELITAAQTIDLVVTGKDKYGRLLGRVMLDGKNVSDQLLAEGLVRPYKGGRRKGWC